MSATSPANAVLINPLRPWAVILTPESTVDCEKSSRHPISLWFSIWGRRAMAISGTLSSWRLHRSERNIAGAFSWVYHNAAPLRSQTASVRCRHAIATFVSPA
jgi:hypothetical protein